MPRPQRELDPGGGPVVAFARDLRELRVAAGTPKFATMERRTGRSRSTLAEAVGGRHLPRWETVADFVRACETDPEPWRARWEAVRTELARIEPGAVEPGAVEPARTEPAAPVDPAGGGTGAAPDGGAPAEVPSGEPPSVESPAGRAGVSRRPARRGVRRTVLVAAAVAAALVLVGGGFALGRMDTPGAGPPWVRAVEVQNKVALGADRLVEDTTPAYLSTLPLAYCKAPDRHCAVPGTDMASGVGIVANCQTHGQQMWNYDLAEAAARGNPDRAASSLWYRASFPDGRSGYISEVYLTAPSRGGLGLPDCGPTPGAGSVPAGRPGS